MLDVVRSHLHGWAYESAMSVRQTFALRESPTEEDLGRVLDGLRMDVVEEELPAGLVEMLSDDTVILARNLARPQRRWAIAHAIGHYLGHSGDQTKLDTIWRWRQERQADVFAGFLLLGPLWLEQAHSVYDLAELANIPIDRVVQWLGWLAC